MRFRFLRLTNLRKPQGVSRPFHSKRAVEASSWTLVELLVVIVIISIIMSFMLPAIMTAQGKAKKTICELQRSRIRRYDELTGLRLHALPVPVLTKCYECHVPNRYRQPNP